MERFANEHDNLRAALEWGLASSQVQPTLRLAAACGHFWRLRGYFREGRERLRAALAQPGAEQPSPARVNALVRAANLAYIQSDYPTTRAYASEALRLARTLGPAGRVGQANALELLGELATETGDYSSAPPLFEQALAIYQELGDRNEIAAMRMQLGWAAMRAGDDALAERHLNASLELARGLDDAIFLGLVLSGLGELAVRQKQYDRATSLLEESLAIRRTLGERWGIATSLGTLGWVALLQRDFAQMRTRLRRV